MNDDIYTSDSLEDDDIQESRQQPTLADVVVAQRNHYAQNDEHFEEVDGASIEFVKQSVQRGHPVDYDTAYKYCKGRDFERLNQPKGISRTTVEWARKMGFEDPKDLGEINREIVKNQTKGKESLVDRYYRKMGRNG